MPREIRLKGETYKKVNSSSDGHGGFEIRLETKVICIETTCNQTTQYFKGVIIETIPERQFSLGTIIDCYYNDYK